MPGPIDAAAANRPSRHSAPPPPIPADTVAAVRRFNREWTSRIGVLDEALLDSPYSLAEARVLFELAHRERPSATALAADLRIDPGYLSRILRRFARDGLVARQPAPDDARRAELTITTKGRDVFAALNARQDDVIRTMLAPMGPSGAATLVETLRAVSRLTASPIQAAGPATPAFTLRPPRTGDLGWVVWRHGVLYGQEFGWNTYFEGLVAEVIADFTRTFDPARERCWIAEQNGRNLGSVFLVKKSESVAKLRLLLVEPDARGLGVGKALVAACVDFARACGYRMITLWTNDNLQAARHIYRTMGFMLVDQEPHEMFGPPSVGETWELPL